MGQRRPFRVVFDEPQNDGSIRRGTVTTRRLDQARCEADAIARGGRRAEVHYVAEDGEHEHLEEFVP